MILAASTLGTIVATVAAFLVITLLLVALLLFVKQKLSPSGPVKITINGERTIEVGSGGTLLSTLGAEKIFIVGVEQPKEPIHAQENNPHPPTTASIAGHMLDSIFSDTLQSDIERMERINHTLSLIPDETKKNNSGLKNIESYVLNPSHDFNSIAVNYYEKLPLSIRLLLRSIGISNDAESSLLSYLLFEKSYCKELINLGFNDALEQEHQIRAFLKI